MENMGEIDTKPIDSVQAGISLFGAIGDQNKHKLTANNVRWDGLRIYLQATEVQL